MNDNRRAGAAIMISMSLLIIAAIFLSTGWINEATIIYNILSAIRIRYFDEDINSESICKLYNQDCSYGIDFPTKYAILLFLAVAAYGLAIYMDVLPVPWRKWITRDIKNPR